QVLVQSVIARNDICIVDEPVAMLNEQLDVPIIFAFNQGRADTDLNGPITVGHVHPCIIIKRMMGWGVVLCPGVYDALPLMLRFFISGYGVSKVWIDPP